MSATFSNTKPLALYVHWPFCKSKCPYCDFNSHVASSIDHAEWRRAYRQALASYASFLPDRRVTSVFFGGGTPSLMEPVTVGQIMDDVARLWATDTEVEITLEANPTSVEAEKFAGFRQAGVNRLSLGVQALNDRDLKFLGREHSAAEARAAIDLMHQFFPRSSFDLIYARHEQTLDAWERELREAVGLTDGHLSLYQLTIEPTTLFHTRHQRGEDLTAPEDTAATMYERTQDILEAEGLPAYEVSNHAKPGDESRHNLTYWKYHDYIGIGPGAHGRYMHSGFRHATDDHRAPDVWLRHVSQQGWGVRGREIIDTPTAMREALMMGLRLKEGIDLQEWAEKFDTPFDAFVTPKKTSPLEREQYLQRDATRLRATASGMQRLNALLKFLLS